MTWMEPDYNSPEFFFMSKMLWLGSFSFANEFMREDTP